MAIRALARRTSPIFNATRNVYQEPSSGKQSATATEPIRADDLELIDSHKFCVAQVRRHDRENYLAALCLKDKLSKRIVFGLRAFNVELSLIRDLTSDADRAKIRFHFWSKLIDEIVRRDRETDPNIAKETAYYKHTPVAKELLDLFYRANLDQAMEAYLRDLVGARVSSKVLGHKQFETLEELELYCRKSNSSLYQLAWRLDMHLHSYLSAKNEMIPTLERISDTLGLAHGLSNVIRGIPYNSRRNCCYVPKDIIDQFSLSKRDFLGKHLNGTKIRPAVEYLSNRCELLLKEAYGDLSYITSNYRPLFLPHVSIRASLKRLRRCNYDICDSKANERNNLLALSMKLNTVYFRAPVFWRF